MDVIKAEQDYGAKALLYCKNTPDEKDKRWTIRPGSEEWKMWERYFTGFLGFEPAMMKFRDGRFNAMTVPAQWPEWFDSDYAKHLADGGSLSFVKPQDIVHARPPHHRASVYVPADNAMFPQMVDRARNADANDYRYDQERGGIWVVHGWVEGDNASSKRATKRFTADDLRRIYARHDEANEVAA